MGKLGRGDSDESWQIKNVSNNKYIKKQNEELELVS